MNIAILVAKDSDANVEEMPVMAFASVQEGQSFMQSLTGRSGQASKRHTGVTYWKPREESEEGNVWAAKLLKNFREDDHSSPSQYILRPSRTNTPLSAFSKEEN